mgnify:CR=1 FL=1
MPGLQLDAAAEPVNGGFEGAHKQRDTTFLVLMLLVLLLLKLWVVVLLLVMAVVLPVLGLRTKAGRSL